MSVKPYKLKDIVHISGVDHPESISIDAEGNAFTTGTGGQVYRLNLIENKGVQFASTAPRRILGQAIDADGNLYCADCSSGKILQITQDGRESTYATGPEGKKFLSANYPAFDRKGNMYLSDSGDWSDNINGLIYKILPDAGEAQVWFSEPVNTPNAIALDSEEQFLYFVETYGDRISRIAINSDGTAGALEPAFIMPERHIPDGIAFDDEERLWIACHRPDAIYVYDFQKKKLELFAHDWRGDALRGPTDVAFAGADRDILLAASLDNLCVHRFDNVGVHGLRLNHPKL